MWHVRAYKGFAWRYGSKTGRLQYMAANGQWLDQPMYMESNGYFSFSVGRKRVLVHRFVWYLVTGKMPSDQVDHIDQNKLNYRIENLREVSQTVNMHNRTKQSNNTSGVKGVYWHPEKQKWRASIRIHNKLHSAMYRLTKEEAIQDRKDLEAKFQNIIQLPIKDQA